MASRIRDVKNIIFVGDSGIGKTTVIHHLLGLSIPPQDPTAYRHISVFEIRDKFRVQVLDIPASPEVASRRKEMYEFAHAIALCFAIDNPASFQAACGFWLTETDLYVPGKPRKVLVGLKKDLRNDPSTIARLQQQDTAPVSVEAAVSKQEDLGLNAYVECSSKKHEGMMDVFETCLVNMGN